MTDIHKAAEIKKDTENTEIKKVTGMSKVKDINEEISIERETDTIVVLDFGGQYSQLIARRVRECQVYSLLLSYDTPLAEIVKLRPKGIILSGGPASVQVEGAPKCDPHLFGLGIPVLGICYGLQLMAHLLGGKVTTSGISEYGKTELSLDGESSLLQGLNAREDCWMSHRDSVTSPPSGFRITARTLSTPVAAMEDEKRKLYGVQFHPEVRHTLRGMDILKNFLFEICKCLSSWDPASIIEITTEAIRRQVGAGRAICALSGGVDSACTALLVHRAIGDRLSCVFVDHGLLRYREAEQVVDAFQRHLRLNLIFVDGRRRFLARLQGVVDPEEKRRIIGEEFIRIFEEEARNIRDVRFLVQGTLYPDVIESGTRDAARIKSHHNVAGLPETMDLELVEPLRLLFKDEVRAVAQKLGLPEEIVGRHPFPGPGLAVRIIGEVTPERLEMLRRADRIVEEEIKSAGLYSQVWQAFAVLPGIRSVGVMGDERTYAYPIAIRVVESEDAMTADWSRLPYPVLEKMASRIMNEVEGVNRVVYDISSKPPSTIEWE
ncbi:GMP synthase (glutamine-hydrolysing) [Candidatus Hakubella thermalkaliphila]|uniref:GMP synthase [glutamine-hydrolyzing] n=3 Tax=Candidatus Hakubella thermalkaliphila TaxID=2754717 RepID=A0A6V8QDZ0_9ACTN|nr:glutamine-hydrolyzing GMP synthase [Candidatus Hakubella thermalkaliphila]GFP26612.1 GMP synthase (glutamine-hydrolysing) [Candidatus Hakubella thermalkaliphila]GFP35395.1 GMP synthase (glutamine-hydrolysing) [Candidatus Hakubella thermalkaliphila]GFP42640.1 GMP synthase (glutamine-hydrolysing) [Candidatus Hakubella thermalkaliphila]